MEDSDTSTPGRACRAARTDLADGDPSAATIAHRAACPECAGFASALAEVERRLEALVPDQVPYGAVERAIRMVAAGQPLRALQAVTAAPVAAATAGSGGRRRRRTAQLVGAVIALAAAVGLVLAVSLPGSPTPSTNAAELRDAARRTAELHSAHFTLGGTLGLDVDGVTINAGISGTGETQFPDRGELQETTNLAGTGGLSSEQVVGIGDVTWVRLGTGKWVRHVQAAGQQSAIDQSLTHPSEALAQLSRIGYDYHTVSGPQDAGVPVTRIALFIPGGDFHGFGQASQQVARWAVQVDLGPNLVLRALVVTGSGSVAIEGQMTPFTYHLTLDLSDFGATVDIQPPP